ncbi:hypothetical protein GGTG_13471 [Gaeumannomyces tritici R3-111a-1]|uniref:Uncharacterized protein n=1 Tax=Gaeumannomyces tritici (strain R3-111a-1) TaxID=644352 RepID=J3PIZ1_GAET3|nr:hypothetical protein GGTG_13471 [Gaeumannomyces tritici R3-111a-1]EJT68965.1 hypothetical protein GGTG_13471 [Gaeumannomyces tritici R3-111a-1]
MEPELNEDSSNLYFKYKNHERNAFNALFPGQPYGQWTLKSLYSNVANVAPNLQRQQLSLILNDFKQSVKARKEHSLGKRYGHWQIRQQHAAFETLIQQIIDLLETVTTKTDDKMRHQKKGFKDNSLLGEADFARFLEDIELLVEQASALWLRAAAGDIRYSTASTNIPQFLKDMVKPMMEANIPPAYAPIAAQMIIRHENALFGCEKPFAVNVIPFEAVVAASYVRKILDSADHSSLSQIVQTRIREADIETQENRGSYNANDYSEWKSLLNKIRRWASNYPGPVSLAHLLVYLECQICKCRKSFIYGSAHLQTFAYICESIRFNGMQLPPALEALFNNSSISPFLWYAGRPKNLKDCLIGIEKWSDPCELNGRSKKLTQHIFESRDKPMLAERIIESGGKLTRAMLRNSKSKWDTLEIYLERELDVPNTISLEDCLDRGARFLAAKTDMRDIWNTKASRWFYIRYKVLGSFKLENELLDAFMQEWNYVMGTSEN